MRAPCAERRRPPGHIVGNVDVCRIFYAERLLDQPRAQLAVGWKICGKVGNIDTGCPHLMSKVIGAFLDDVKAVDALGKRRQEIFRKRPGNAEFQDGSIGKCLAYMLVHGARAYDAEAASPLLDAVEFTRLHPLLERFNAVELHFPARFRERGHHHPFRRVLLVWLLLISYALPHFDGSFRVGYANGRANDERYIESLRELERASRERERLG